MSDYGNVSFSNETIQESWYLLRTENCAAVMFRLQNWSNKTRKAMRERGVRVGLDI